MSVSNVLKNRDGSVVTRDFRNWPPLIFFSKHCEGHELRWGSACRAMKRRPKGREAVTIECRTCGKYMEYESRT